MCVAPRLAFARSWSCMYAVCMDYTPIVLKNKGIPCEFAKVKKTGDSFTRSYTETGEVEKEVIHVKFTNNSISDIELHFGGLEAWQEQLEKFPITTVRQTLAFALKRDVEETGEAMLDGEVVMYSNVIGTAWSIANGVDPSLASRLLQQSLGLANDQKQALNQELVKTLDTVDSLGTNGSDSGPKRASRSKNSGK
jgi:hypothetical protein